MPELSIQVDGIEEACQFLQEKPKQVGPAALIHGLEAGGAVMEEYIAQATPDKTGALLADLDTVVTLNSDSMGGTADTGFSDAQADVARFVEFGHREVGHEPLKKLEGEVPPHAFMRRAGEAGAEEAIDAFEETFMSDLQAAGVIDG